MRKLFGFLLILGAIGAYFYYVRGWDVEKVKSTPAVSYVLHDESATTTPIGQRGTGTHWETVAPMPDSRQNFGAAAIGDTIYVVGGMDAYSRTLNSLIAYDIAKDAWRTLPNMPQPVDHPAVVTDGSKLYVLGGTSGLAGRMVDSAFAFDPKKGTWSPIGNLSDFRGDADERLGEILEADALHMLAQSGVELHAAEQAAAAQIEIEQAEDAALGQAAGEFLELVQLAGEIAAADQRTDRSAGDHRDFDASLIQRAQHADMRPAACAAAAQRERNACLPRRLRVRHAAGR